MASEQIEQLLLIRLATAEADADRRGSAVEVVAGQIDHGLDLRQAVQQAGQVGGDAGAADLAQQQRRGDGVLYLDTWPAARQGPRQVNFRRLRQEIVDAFAAKFEELWSNEPEGAENSGRVALQRLLV